MNNHANDDDNRSSAQLKDRSRHSDEGGFSLGKLIKLGLVLGAGYVFVKQFPELQRYMKMKKM